MLVLGWLKFSLWPALFDKKVFGTTKKGDVHNSLQLDGSVLPIGSLFTCLIFKRTNVKRGHLLLANDLQKKNHTQLAALGWSKILLLSFELSDAYQRAE